MLRNLKDFLKGLLFYNIGQHFYAERRGLEKTMMIGIFGPLIGIPHLFHYYTLRLMPYFVRQLPAWKRSMVKEKDFFDQVGD